MSSSSSFSWTSSTLSPILSAFCSLVLSKLLIIIEALSPFSHSNTSLIYLVLIWSIRWSVSMYPLSWSTWSWTSSTPPPILSAFCSLVLSKLLIIIENLSPFSHSNTSLFYLVLIWYIRWSVSMVLSTPPPIHSGFSSLVPCKLFIILLRIYTIHLSKNIYSCLDFLWYILWSVINYLLSSSFHRVLSTPPPILSAFFLLNFCKLYLKPIIPFSFHLGKMSTFHLDSSWYILWSMLFIWTLFFYLTIKLLLHFKRELHLFL